MYEEEYLDDEQDSALSEGDIMNDAIRFSQAVSYRRYTERMSGAFVEPPMTSYGRGSLGSEWSELNGQNVPKKSMYKIRSLTPSSD